MSAALVEPAPVPSALADGLHANVPPSVYYVRELAVASKSGLDLFARTPATFRAWVHEELSDEDTPALTFGTALHMAALEPERFAREYVVEPDFGDCRFKENKATRDAWRLAHASRTLITAADMATLLGMQASLRRHPVAGPMLERSARELTLRWTDRETGLACKARADLHDDELAVGGDLKSAEDASWAGFRRASENYRYHWQDGFYRDGFASCAHTLGLFFFIMVEKRPPFLVGLYEHDPDDLAAAGERMKRLKGRWAECLAKNVWPGLPEGIQTVKLRPWAL